MRATRTRPPSLRCLILLALLLPSTTSCAAARARCGAIKTFADGMTPSSEIHVSTTGSNASGDGSASNPFATISFAALQARAGAAVVIHEGTYGGGIFLNDLHGTAAAPIWIGGAPGETRPLISGGGEGLHLVRPQYLIVHDLEIANSANNGVNADDGGEVDNPRAAHHVLFRGLFIHHVGGTGNQDGLKLSGLNQFAVIDCEIANCGGDDSGSGIDMVGCHHGLIARCNLHDFQGSGNAVQCKGGSEDVEIRWCRLSECGQRAVNVGGSTGFEFFRPPLSTTSPNAEAWNIRVLANIIEGANASIAFVGCVQSVAAHNTIVDPHNWILRILQETTTSGGYEFLPCGNNGVVNNLVYFDRSDLSTHINIGPNTNPGSFTFANNLWYAHDNPSLSIPTLPVAERNGIYGQDPLLADVPGGDYHLSAKSPAVESGQPPAPVAGDHDGACYRKPPSIGAFELPLATDINGDGTVDVDDLVVVISGWGPCPPSVPDGLPGTCPPDIAPPGGNGTVNIDDLLLVIGSWSGA